MARRLPAVVLLLLGSGLRGDCSGLRGDCSRLTGDCSGLRGDCSGLTGDFDDIPASARPCSLADWTEAP